jgi:phosphate starvation-inducible PhoH-like protein
MKGGNNTPRTRKAKAEAGSEKHIKEKFAEQREDSINAKPIKPWNGKQKYYIELLNDPDIPTILCTGYAGTSKTFLPTALAADALRLGKIKKIVFSRPNISNSKSLGYFGGSLIEKASNWLLPVLDILNERLGRNIVELYIKTGEITFVPLEVIKGYSANDCVFIIDEAEDLTKDEAKKVITRQGSNCKMVLCGDISQSELKEGSGLKYLTEMSRKYDNLVLGLVDFNEVSDIVRSDAVKQWIIAFKKEENK